MQKTKPKILAYLRISTDKQDLNNQRLAILSYAHKNKLKVKKFIEVQTSSRSTFKERMLDELLANLTAGDTLIVSELSRLGRSLGQVIKIVDELVKKHVQLIAIKENTTLDGASKPCRTRFREKTHGLNFKTVGFDTNVPAISSLSFLSDKFRR